MRCAAVALVLTLLLPSALATGGRSGGLAPGPLDLFGGDPGTRAWSSPLLIVEAYIRALRADEYVTLANVAGTPRDLSGWQITDSEGTLTFPAGSIAAARARVVVAQNATAYEEDTLLRADFRYAAGNATSMIVSGSFQLNNAGDEVILKDPSGASADVLVYGTSSYAGAGWTGAPAKALGFGFVAHRAFDHAWRDTNASGDWDLVRVWSLGQADIAAASFSFTGTATAFVSPDESLSALAGLLENATTSIDLEVYTFTSSALAARLRDALGRQVRVRVLLEGGPVGGIDADEWSVAQGLASAGAEVRFLVNNTTLDIHERYRYVHAKYAVLDERTVVVSSENWGPSGFPAPGLRGSRGWTLAVTHAPLAAYLEGVFAADFDARRRDVFTLADMTVHPVAATPPTGKAREVRLPPRQIAGAFRVTPVLAPDTSLAGETILGAIGRATRSIDAELFYAYPAWDPFPDVYLEALVAAARRGVSVRLLLDASRFNIEDGDPSNNTNTVAYVQGIAASEGLDLQAKLVDLAVHGFTEVHNKGLIVDGRTVLVSSINWNRNSVTANREVGLLVENADVAAYFETAFAWDWKDDVTAPRADAGPDRAVDAGERVAFSGLGSSDDVAVTNYSWDLDGDGAPDHWGPEVATAYRHAGTYAARLLVSDLWGNTANATATVIVRPAPFEADPWFPRIAPLLLIVPIAMFFVARRRRKGINKPPRM